MRAKRTLLRGKQSLSKKKISIPWYGESPGIDEQIKYVKSIPKQLCSKERPSQNDLRMLHAIEQSLLAAKQMQKTNDKINRF